MEGHVKWRTYNRVDFEVFIRDFLGESKVSNFENFVFDHDVGRFQVSMDDTLSDKSQKTITNLCQHVDAIVFAYLFFGLHNFSNISIAKLLDNVIVFATLHYVDKLNDVRIMD